MYTDNDLIDALIQALRPPAAVPATPPPKAAGAAPARWKLQPEPGPRARPFLTEHAIKKALTGGRTHLTIPRDAIISPLAEDWLALKGIQITRE